MKLTQYLFIFIILQFSQIIKTDDSIVLETNEEEYVVSLTDQTFDAFVREKEIVLAMFYAPWCTHCKRLEPIINNVAKSLREGQFKLETSIEFVKVDATHELVLAKNYTIERFPTLLFFRNHHGMNLVHPFDGDLTNEQTILTYLKNEARSGWTPSDEKSVKDLTQRDFTQWTSNRKLSLVKFYADNAKCKELEPEYEQASKYLVKNSKPIYLAQVNCDYEEEICDKYQVKVYPTLAIFRDGRPFDYNGGKKAQEIIDFMIKSQNPASIEVNSFASLKTHIKNPIDNYVLGIFKSENDPLYESYMKFTSRYPEDLKMFHSFQYAAFENHLTMKFEVPCIITFIPDVIRTKNEPNGRVFSKEDASADDIEQFVFKNGLPTISVVNQKSKRYIFSHVRPVCFVFYDVDFSAELKAHTLYYRNKIEPVAKKYTNITFALVNEHDHLDMMKDFGLFEREDDISLVCLNDKHHRFVFDGNFETQEIEKFVNNFATQSIKPKYRTEIEPNYDSTQLIRVVVGSSFERLITLERKDVFLYIYRSKDCTNCTLLEKVFQGMAKKLAHHKDLVCAKLDMEKNEYPSEFRHSSVPALFFYGAHDKHPILMSNFNVDTPLEELMKYIQVLLNNAQEKKMEKVKLVNEKGKNEL